MLCTTPTKYFFAAGCSNGFTTLNAFDGALLKAGVGNTNLVRMSSILPPKCIEINPIKLPYGALIPVAYASITSETPEEIISSAVAICFPKDETKPGLIMEFSDKTSQQYAEEKVRKMAEKGMIMRGEEVKEIRSISVENKVEITDTSWPASATWAGVVLWY